MDELINLVAQRTGIPADKARTAVETVVTHLKARLPAPLASQLDSILAGGGGTGSAAGGLGDLAKGLGGMFGKER